MLRFKLSPWRRILAATVLLLLLAANIQIVAYANNGFTVLLVDGEKTTPCYATARETVEAFLERLDKQLGEHDIVSKPLDQKLESNMIITVTRREYVTVSETKTMKYKTIYAHSPEVKAGEERIVQEGSDGKSQLTWSVLMVNGKEESRELVKEVSVIATIDRRVEMGFRSIPFSKMNFETDFDENHEPVQYKNVLRDQRSAGYSAKPGAGTASGIAKAGVGYVAVNPNVIPYGSKLFIQSADGKFIYGYAIAADTGTALMEGIIAVDCFYDTYKESADHGIRIVDIFVLE